MSLEPLGIGFIGTGEVSILHARAMTSIPTARLVGAWNYHRELCIERTVEWGVRCFESAEELVADPQIDAVFVLTNLETHLKYARMAMEAGKHVLVEKPLCATVAEVEEMKAVSDRTKKICVPGHNMIHEASLSRARELIQHGDLGKIVSCYVLYNIHHSEERASTLPGMVRHILTHNLYTMIYLAGKPKRVTALKAMRHYEHLEKEDLAMALIELENGGLAHLCASFAADDHSVDPWSFLVKVIGTAGTTHYTYQDWVEQKKGISHSRTYTAYQATITNEDRYFVDEIVRGGKEPLSSLEDAVLCQKAIEAVEKSIAESKTISIV
jgi:predicted dehydrogenase